ncbi:hypothetical protein T439DRAFT_367964 [Meredithblackwellia eburnea MCA 4105]
MHPWNIVGLLTLPAVATSKSCNPTNSGLDPFSHAYTSDCHETEWCSISIPHPQSFATSLIPRPTSAAQKVLSGYSDNSSLPPLCPDYQYCPDEGDQCRDLLPFGGNFNGSLCLNLRCKLSNITAGGACEVDNTVYTGFAPDGTTYSDIVTRDNCATGLYCDNLSLTCKSSLPLNSPCNSDRECSTFDCSPLTGQCAMPPETPSNPGAGVYALVGIGLLAGLIGTVTCLLSVDRKQKKRRRRERAEAWQEQRELRRAILSLQRAMEGVE